MQNASAKIAMMGDSETDKSALICQFLAENMAPLQESYKSTLGADFHIIELKGVGAEVHLYLWDLNSQEAFKTLRSYYLHGANVVLIVFDLTRHETLEYVYQWHEAAKSVNPDVSCILIGMNLDLREERKIPDDEIDQVSVDLACPVILASTTTGENCEKILPEVATLVGASVVFS
jgi:small GTP-binding protein